MTTRIVHDEVPPIHGVGRFDDPVILNATANTSVDAYHSHGGCDILQKISSAKVVHRDTAAWHDVDECGRCATLRRQDQLDEREAIAMTVDGDLPDIDASRGDA